MPSAMPSPSRKMVPGFGTETRNEARGGSTMICLKRRMIGALVVAAVALLAQPAGAVQFTWSEQGGFEWGTATLRAGGFFAPDLPPVAGHGGLEFFQLQAPPAPANTYRTIGWGCACHRDNDGAGGPVT